MGRYDSFQRCILHAVVRDTDGQFGPGDNETIVFVAPVNESQVGPYGTYDYEIRLPDTLDTYVPGSTTATIYVELI